MGCPYHGLARLPGQAFESAGREMRRTLQDAAFDIESVLTHISSQNMRTKAGRQAVQAASYGAASLVIDHYWKFLKEQPIKERLTALRRVSKASSHAESVCELQGVLLTLFTEMRDQFAQLLSVRMKSSPSQISRKDELFLVFASATQRRTPARRTLPFPQISDLSSLLGRMVGIAPATFLRDVGRAPTHAELCSLLREPAVFRFFVEVMTNKRETVLPLLAWLEGQTSCNLDDPERRFNPNHFEVVHERGAHALRLKANIAITYREILAQNAKGKVAQVAMGCPVLYGGKFKEMYDWMLDLYLDWLALEDSLQ